MNVYWPPRLTDHSGAFCNWLPSRSTAIPSVTGRPAPASAVQELNCDPAMLSNVAGSSSTTQLEALLRSLIRVTSSRPLVGSRVSTFWKSSASLCR